MNQDLKGIRINNASFNLPGMQSNDISINDRSFKKEGATGNTSLGAKAKGRDIRRSNSSPEA